MAKKNKVRGHFAGVPDPVMMHPNYINLSFAAKALLFEFALQYRGKNNGKLCAIYQQLKRRGWKSEATLRRALNELLQADLIVRTKIGVYGYGGKKPNFYAITWQNIDDIPGFDMDVSHTIKPLRAFSLELKNQSVRI